MYVYVCLFYILSYIFLLFIIYILLYFIIYDFFWQYKLDTFDPHGLNGRVVELEWI